MYTPAVRCPSVRGARRLKRNCVEVISHRFLGGCHRRHGLTLIELLVVLLILSILTVVAVQSTDVLIDQGRFDSTQRTLQNIEEAVLGPPNQRQQDGSMFISGFVADIGRGPLAAGNDPANQLAELLTRPAGLEVFGIKQAPTDPEVLVPCGWRGPYLRLPIGATDLRNGWANTFQILRADGNPAMNGEPIDMIGSLGANNAVGGASYEGDTSVIFRSTAGLIDRYGASLAGQVILQTADGQPRDATGPVTVNLYGPNPATGGVAATSVVATQVIGSQGVYTFAGLPTTAGPRVVRAYEGTPTTLKSRPLSLAVPAGGVNVTLTIRSAAAPMPPPT
jgi:prepilin-type N-terminal cleavage/methylation domain-containing protein